MGDAEGAAVEVKWSCPHRHGEEEIVVLMTPSTKLLVTKCHRVVKKSAFGKEVVRTEDVKNGDEIVVGQRAEQVSVQSQFIETSTIELGFDNDASVEAWFISDGIVTKGQSVNESHSVRMQCKEEPEEEDSLTSEKDGDASELMRAC